ncbi:winged helix-turn-helix domain-containing protein [Streptomyces sp. NPDC048550]|uniref:winged helix-turn-helix domain-containing protein n=1 Tax=Streptomyces sp. NPDC048550 TaxID=3155739 RepID=UPI00343D0AB8
MHGPAGDPQLLPMTGYAGECAVGGTLAPRLARGRHAGPALGGPGQLPDRHRRPVCRARGELGKDPSAHGFEDERWTLVRVQTVIRRLRLTWSVASVWRLLKRLGWSSGAGRVGGVQKVEPGGLPRRPGRPGAAGRRSSAGCRPWGRPGAPSGPRSASVRPAEYSVPPGPRRRQRPSQ